MEKFINKHYKILIYTIIVPLAIVAIVGITGLLVNIYKYGL